MPPRVYVVDDDSLVTVSLGTALRLETDWEIVTHTQPGAALLAMETAPPDVVLSDLQMPGLDGIRFLKQVRARHADAVLILLTGYADKESAIRAINEVGIWQYVEKPWDTGDLLVKVKQGMERRELTASLSRQTAELSQRVRELEGARQRLVSSERLAAVGRVMSGLAHEIGNQLGLIGYAEAIVARSTDPEVQGYARQIVSAQRRLAAMIDEIKDYSRGESPFPRVVGDVAAALEEAQSILRFDAEVRTRKLEVTIRARPLGVIHRNKLVQVVINLVRNAAQASSVGGRIEVTLDDDQGALLRVVDRGAGIPEDVLARLRTGEPFFSTKEGGSGLGLGISRRIVEEHGGTLELRSRAGEGTTVEMRLPPLEAEDDAADRARPGAPAGA